MNIIKFFLLVYLIMFQSQNKLYKKPEFDKYIYNNYYQFNYYNNYSNSLNDSTINDNNTEKLIDDIRAEKNISAEKLDYMNEIDQYLKQMRQTYEKVL